MNPFDYFYLTSQISISCFGYRTGHMVSGLGLAPKIHQFVLGLELQKWPQCPTIVLATEQ